LWIIDSDVIDHAIHIRHHFVTFYKIKHVSIKLLNGYFIMFRARIVQFFKSFIIFNVLYVPDFLFNIIYA